MFPWILYVLKKARQKKLGFRQNRIYFPKKDKIGQQTKEIILVSVVC